MKILLTGATGYIGKRLIPVLLDQGHEVICTVRDKKRFQTDKYPADNLAVVECNFLEPESLNAIPADIDIAFYLIHSMAASIDDFESLERQSAENFKNRIEQTGTRQVVYLSGIVNEEALSKHLRSRKAVEEILATGRYALTTLRAGIIVGSGSASFEIIRDLVEKLPVMVTPRWLNTLTQPIAIRNVIQFLTRVAGNPDCYRQSYDISGPETLSYREMLLRFAKIRKLRRYIWVVPVMTPKLSSYWLYFITSTSYKLAVNLVNSMKIPIIGRPNDLHERLGIRLIPYEEAVQSAFDSIRQQDILSSWTDALSSSTLEAGISRHIQVPDYGCFKDERSYPVSDESECLRRIWSLGGQTGWYYANALWAIRGFLDKMAGGVGLRRGRRSAVDLQSGDALDFWRVLLADKQEKRLMLYAEMKLPGEAWLEFHIREGRLYQVATFRPRGWAGRIYWYAVLPFHGLIFRGMIRKLATGS